jgi:hypothetical protein
MTKKFFTQEEMDIIRQNSYVISVSSSRIIYSLDFKKFAVEQAARGLKSPDIFVKAGFDPDILGTSRMYAAIKKFKKEAASPEGLRETSSKTREQRMAQFAKEEYDKKHTKVALRELQKKVVHLEQQLEFLKKIHFPEE